MSKVKIQGNASGTGVVTLTAPNTNTDRTITLPDETVSLTGAPAGLDDVSGVARATSGLLFNGDTAAANALDDYEEGTWTPTLTPSTSGTITTGGQLLTYTKVGRMVTVGGYFDVASVSSPVGRLELGGLPFAVGYSNTHQAALAINMGGTNSLTGYGFTGHHGIANNLIKIQQYTQNSIDGGIADNVVNATFMRIGMTYFTA